MNELGRPPVEAAAVNPAVADTRLAQKPGYRPEVDGLRAVAVLPVILFHAGVPGFSGGFIGVDVFFVISGYLITSVLVRELDAGDFSIIRFYERRARRILPALFLVMACCLPFAWWFMLPDDLQNFGQSVTATTLFSNNILLFLTSSYFELAAELKPLLHTWSLGVEEQFYLIYPPLLWLCWRVGRNRAVYAVLGLTIASLMFCEIAWRLWPEANFYLLTSRLWELGLGALLALLPLEQLVERRLPSIGRNIASAIGVAMILAAVFLFGEATPFPSLLGLIPVLGTCLVIACARKTDALSGALLANSPIVLIGLTSYSIYLWHQPLLAFARIASLREPTWTMLAPVALVSLPLAYFSWRFWEKPFRDNRRVSRRTIWAFSALGIVLFTGAGVAMHASAGFPQRWEDNRQVTGLAGRARNAEFNDEPLKFFRREFSNSDKRNLLVIGNSFSRDFINAGLVNGYFRDFEISYFKKQPNCIFSTADVNKLLLERIRQADVIVFGNPPRNPRCWSRDKSILSQIAEGRFIVIGTKNFGWNMNSVMKLTREERSAFRAPMIRSVQEQHALLQRTIPRNEMVDPVTLLGDQQGRMPVVTPEGNLISQDTTHLTPEGAAYFGKILFSHPLLRDLR